MPKILNSYKEDITMIKGLAITPPVLGRISIGKIVEKNGKRLPEPYRVCRRLFYLS
uniref:hypothetical protein n=1 Tax=Acinetobacter haemolyticus TaxID=29430 RepID=UPI00031CF1CB|nr:hypothetical protein [Acinetobacter haemolyticus]